MTSKPKGLAKIWREIKRPFQHVRQIWRNLRDDGDEMRKPYERVIQKCVDKAMQRHMDVIREHMDQRCTQVMKSGRKERRASILHERAFSKFKNAHQGQEVVVVATGPTAKDYKRIDGAIHIGVNRAFQIENIDLHYLFLNDYMGGVRAYIKEANLYKPEGCTKFYGTDMPEHDVCEANALRYQVNGSYVVGKRDKKQLLQGEFNRFLDIESFFNFRSGVFPTMQFAL